MALIATSGTNSSTRTRWPTTREARISRPRLHQVRPTSALKPIAIRTPTTTEFTRRMLVVSVEYRVTWTTSRAVSGAVSGFGSLLRRSATT